MPRPRPCLGHNGRCQNLTTNPTGRCDACRHRRDKGRGSREERGYDHRHRTTRAAWEPVVQAGQATCWRCLVNGLTPEQARITPTEPWDLGHHPDRVTASPEHRRCNRATNERGRRVGG